MNSMSWICLCCPEGGKGWRGCRCWTVLGCRLSIVAIRSLAMNANSASPQDTRFTLPTSQVLRVLWRQSRGKDVRNCTVLPICVQQSLSGWEQFIIVRRQKRGTNCVPVQHIPTEYMNLFVQVLSLILPHLHLWLSGLR